MKKIIALVLAVVLLVACSSALFVSAEESGFGPKKALTAGAEGGEASGAYEEEIAAKVGKKNESAAFDVILDSCAGKDGKTVKVTLSVGNITGELTGIVFPICYDAERLTLIASKNADGTIAFAREGFGSKWENLTTAKADEGKIEFQMIVADDLTQVLKAGGTYTATFTFELKDGYDEAGLWIANDAVRGMTKDFRRCSGNGSYTIAERQEGLIPLHIELSGKGSVVVNDQTINCVDGTVEEELDILPYENQITISIVPESGYHIASITVDGVDYSIKDFLELNITEETFVVITFEPTGDANGDGKLDAFDYQMLKAFVTGAYTGANDEQKLSMDVNHDGRIDAFDYQMLKAHVLGTYVIK